MSKFLAYFIQKLDEEYHRLSLWYFVFFIAGILVYFTLEHEPSLRYITALFLTSFTTLYLRKYGLSGIFISGIIIAFTYGLFVGKYRESKLGMFTISKSVNAFVVGDVAGMKPTTRGMQVVLSDVSFGKKYSAQSMPNQVRVNIKFEHVQDIMLGDRIGIYAMLAPSSRTVLPGGYDFGLYAYFSGIGAVGYALSKPKVFEYSDHKQSSANALMQDIRRKVYKRLIDVMGVNRGNFAAAILLGEGSGLNREVMQNMRLAGISHILCVSGLHLSLVAMLFFTTSRIILNLSDVIAFRYNIKTIAAIVSFFGSFGYLLFSGMQIAATRAFIMTSVFIFSIIIGRNPYPLRSMGIAAVIILSMNPEYVMHPSFQLSFVAVLSLISGYEFYVKNQWIFGNTKGLVASIKLNIFSNIYSSLVASAATTPIVIYHFYISSNYSILANLIAVPMMSFFMMPIVILALLLMPLKLDYYLLKMLGVGEQIVMDTAEFTVNLPYSVWYFGYITPTTLLVFMLGFFWVALWQKSWRYFGWLIIVVSIAMMVTLSTKPDVIFDPYINTIGIKDTDNALEIYTKHMSKFSRNYWANWFGQKDAIIHKTDVSVDDHSIRTSSGRIININYQTINCDADLVLNMLDDRKCQNVETLIKSELDQCGAILIFCSKDQCNTRFDHTKRFKFWR